MSHRNINKFNDDEQQQLEADEEIILQPDWHSGRIEEIASMLQKMFIILDM